MIILMRRLVVLALLASGGLLCSDACWLKFKEVLSQHLLRHAWEETLRTGCNIRPWPWADTWPVARLTVPRLGVDLIVLEGDSGAVLAFGPGHLPVSSPPGGGGNCVLAGHRDSSFSFLGEIKKRDVVTVQITDGSIHSYLINEMFTERAENLYLPADMDKTLTMITCYPLAGLIPGTEYRYLVLADRISV